MTKNLLYTKFTLLIWLAFLANRTPLLADILPLTNHTAYRSYCVVVSKQTYAVPEWKTVVGTLRTKYDASVIIYPKDVTQTKTALSRIMPGYVCFVQQPQYANIEFVTAVQRLTRGLDNDPYTDAVWGILTGYDVADALRIASRTEPLIVRNILSGTSGVGLDAFDEGMAFDEGRAGGRLVKKIGGDITEQPFPADSTKGLVDAFNDGPDAFFTSGHGTPKGWQIGYSYSDGFFECKEGKLFGKDTQGGVHEINSPNSKVYLPVGNCLIGRIPKRDCFALAMMHNGGVDQMFGYTVVTFFGYMGWGTNTYFTVPGGRYSLSESFYANQQALLYMMETEFPKLLGAEFDKYDIGVVLAATSQYYPGNRKAFGLLWDRDGTAFYGDPAWKAVLPPQTCDWADTLTNENNSWRFTIKTRNDGTWPDRPIIAYLPGRFTDIELMTGEEYRPRITDNFLLVPLTGPFKANQQFTITFKARPVKAVPTSAVSAPIYISTLGTAAHHNNANLKLPTTVPNAYQARISKAVIKAGDNADQLITAIKKAPPEQTDAVCFLIANMPERDLEELSSDYILENVQWAYKAKDSLPWGETIPKDIFFNEILPYAGVNEKRDNWRKDFYHRFFELIKDCKTPGQAAVKLNRNMWEMVGVKYSTQRVKADQSPYESIGQGLASCTGLSILFIDACRSVCVPARFVGVPQWTTKRGNHSWVEVWDDGWHFTGAFEPDDLDKAWFIADAAKADPIDPMYCIYATSFRKTDIKFPCAWDVSVNYINAVNVTDRYLALNKINNGKKTVAIILLDKAKGDRIPADIAIIKESEIVGSGKTRTETNDTNDMLEFELSPNSKYTIKISSDKKTVQADFVTTEQDHQKFEFIWTELESER